PNNFLEKFQCAAIWTRGGRDVMRREDGPSSLLPVQIDQVFHGLDVIPASFEKVCRQLIEICSANIEPLTAGPTAQKMFPGPPFRHWSRLADWIRKRTKLSSRNEF